jgi:hypothetical protein
MRGVHFLISCVYAPSKGSPKKTYQSDRDLR